jgi:hypothetical protein
MSADDAARLPYLSVLARRSRKEKFGCRSTGIQQTRARRRFASDGVRALTMADSEHRETSNRIELSDYFSE